MPLMKVTRYTVYKDGRKARQCHFLKSEWNYGIREFRALKRENLPPEEAAQQKRLFIRALDRDRERAQRFGCKWALHAAVPLGRHRR